MATTVKIDTGKFDRALAELSAHMKMGARELVEQQARGYVRKAASITPPSQGKLNLDSRRRGERAITRDLRAIFAPVQLKRGKGKRREAHPDIESIWTAVPNRGRRKVKRARPPYYVDQRKFRALEKDLHGRVGKAASGFNAAAKALGVKLPLWLSRHGEGQGSVRISVRGDGGKYRITITNEAAHIGDFPGLPSALETAARMQVSAMLRRAKYLQRQAAKKAGFRA